MCYPNDPVIVNLIASLFEWVAENLCKNAVDAMDGAGSIDITVDEDERWVYVDVKDTGKGIAKGNFDSVFKPGFTTKSRGWGLGLSLDSVFKPGFTTKSRGWGLGLSLAKRIVEDYHKGKIYVVDSELGVGTTFRIELPKTPAKV